MGRSLGLPYKPHPTGATTQGVKECGQVSAFGAGLSPV